MATGIYSWSQTAASNNSADSEINWAEGQAPSSVNDSARAVMRVISKWRDDQAGVKPSNAVMLVAGSTTVYTLTTNASIATLTNGWTVTFRIDTALGNTGAVTLNVDGTGAKALRGVTGAALVGGELRVGGIYTATYYQPVDQWILHSYFGASSTGVTGPGSTTDTAIAKWNGTGGTAIANSTWLISAGNVLAPVTSDTGALGSGTLMVSDGFWASGAIQNYNNGNLTVTHSAGVLTQTGAYKADTLFDATFRVGEVLLTTATASNAATLSIDLSPYTAYRGLIIRLYGCLPLTTATDLYCRFSTDAGSTYIATGYKYARVQNEEGTLANPGGNAAAQIIVANSLSSGATTCFNGAFEILNQSSTTFQPRISFVGSYATPKELRQHLDMLEEAKKRDHRKLGQELDLFVFSDLVGAGLPLWTPRGTLVRNQLDNFVQSLRDDVGFMPVTVPHITKKDLYEKSGHWSKFADELFRIKTREGHEFAMKPMNCPHHTQIYDSRPRSYRDLPLRYRETTMVYRDEQTGELGGLSRVRSITQDDAHVFCRYSQAKQEVLQLWDVIEQFYTTVGIELSLRLSLHDPQNKQAYMGSDEQWQQIEDELRNIATERKGNDFVEVPGDAAFYGPKLDFLGRDALGRTHQVATIQFDFNQPEGFDLTCSAEDGSEERIVMIHCAVMGSLERFLNIYIEHTAGKFPVWLAPEQVRLITVNQEPDTVAFADKIVQQAKEMGLRVRLDNSNESVGKKIRDAEVWKVPYTVVIGEKEIESDRLTPRIRKDMEVIAAHPELNFGDFFKSVANEAKSRTTKSSL